MEVKNVVFGYDKNILMENLSVKFKKNKITSIIGPNGSGKSTLLMLLSKIHSPIEGEIFLDGKNIEEYSLKEFARQVAVVHQKNQMYVDLNVKTVIGYGRLPYLKYRQSFKEEDYQIVEEIMEMTNLKEYENRPLSTLSGGQQQRVWLGMALAQKTPIMFLDEPTTYLDVKYQIEILNLIKYINTQYNITIVMVHHDINQAIHYSDEIVAMKDGNLLFQGLPNDVITTQSLKDLYSYDLDILENHEQKIVLNYQ